MADTASGSQVVEKSWEEFHRSILSEMDPKVLDAGAVAFSRASFYFGSLAMLEIMQATIEGADAKRLLATMDELRAEVSAYIDGQGQEQPVN